MVASLGGLEVADVKGELLQHRHDLGHLGLCHRLGAAWLAAAATGEETGGSCTGAGKLGYSWRRKGGAASWRGHRKLARRWHAP